MLSNFNCSGSKAALADEITVIGEVMRGIEPGDLDGDFEGTVGLFLIFGALALFSWLIRKLKIVNEENAQTYIQTIGVCAGLYVAFNLDTSPNTYWLFNLFGSVAAGCLTYFALTILVAFVVMGAIPKEDTDEPPKK